jgi:hypothetical protein
MRLPSAQSVDVNTPPCSDPPAPVSSHSAPHHPQNVRLVTFTARTGVPARPARRPVPPTAPARQGPLLSQVAPAFRGRDTPDDDHRDHDDLLRHLPSRCPRHRRTPENRPGAIPPSPTKPGRSKRDTRPTDSLASMLWPWTQHARLDHRLDTSFRNPLTRNLLSLGAGSATTDPAPFCADPRLRTTPPLRVLLQVCHRPPALHLRQARYLP